MWGSILNKLLLDATKYILPGTMTGFRLCHRTADPLLVLRHMIDMNRAGVGIKFGVAFMELSAAYDSIDQNMFAVRSRVTALLRRLRHSLSVEGPITCALGYSTCDATEQCRMP